MHDVHPNEVARLVATVNRLVERFGRLEKSVYMANAALEDAEDDKSATPDDTRVAKLEEDVERITREFGMIKLRLGDVSSRVSATNDKANALRKDVDKILKTAQAADEPTTE